MQRNAPFITRPLVKPSIKRHELWQLFFSSRIQTDRKRNANAAFGVYMHIDSGMSARKHPRELAEWRRAFLAQSAEIFTGSGRKLHLKRIFEAAARSRL